VYVGGYGFAFFPVADAPSMVKRSPTSLVVLRNPDDGYEVTHFQITGITGGTLHQSRDITPINVGDFITTDQGEAGLIFAGAIDGTVSAVSSLNATTNGTGTASATLNFGAPQGPVFSFSSANYLVSKASNTVRITVRKWGGGAAEVNLTTADGTAVAYDSNSATGDYDALSSTQLRFPEGETNKSFNVGIINDQLFTGDRTFWVALTNATGAGKLAYPATAAITIVDDDHIDVRPSLSFRLGEGLSLSGGETGVIYRIDYANNLGSPSNWVALTNVMPGNNSQVISAAEPTIGTQRFFRAVRTP